MTGKCWPAVTFFTYFGDQYSLAANLDWTVTCFVVVLPLVGFTWISYGRRERALDELSRGELGAGGLGMGGGGLMDTPPWVCGGSRTDKTPMGLEAVCWACRWAWCTG